MKRVFGQDIEVRGTLTVNGELNVEAFNYVQFFRSNSVITSPPSVNGVVAYDNGGFNRLMSYDDVAALWNYYATFQSTVLVPLADNSNLIGNDAHRWLALVVVSTGGIAFSDGAHSDLIGYLRGTGPTFYDYTVSKYLHFNLQGLTANRDVTFPDASGTATLLGNTSTGSGSVVLATAPTLTDPVVGTQSQNDNSTKAASTAYVDRAVGNFVVHQVAHGFSVGMPIARNSGAWVQADNTSATKAATAIVISSSGADDFVAQDIGQVTLTTGQWDARTGLSGGLVDGEFYWLGGAGLLTATQPATGYIQRIGQATSNTVLMLDIGDSFVATPVGNATWTTIVKTADETKSSLASVTPDSQLKFDCVSGATYTIRLHIIFAIANGTMDFKYALAYTGTTSFARNHLRHRDPGAAAALGSEFSSVTTTLGGSSPLGTAASSGMVEQHAMFTTTSSGTFSFSWSQNTSDAANATVYAGSYLEYIRVS